MELYECLVTTTRASDLVPIVVSNSSSLVLFLRRQPSWCLQNISKDIKKKGQTSWLNHFMMSCSRKNCLKKKSKKNNWLQRRILYKWLLMKCRIRLLFQRWRVRIVKTYSGRVSSQPYSHAFCLTKEAKLKYKDLQFAQRKLLRLEDSYKSPWCIITSRSDTIL